MKLDLKKKKPPDKIQEQPKPSKRPDARVRKKEHCIFNMLTVKCKLNTFINDKDDISRINQIVLTMNQIAQNAYQLINLRFLLLKSKQSIPRINNNLFYKACCYVSTCKEKLTKPDSEWQLAVSEYRKTLPPKYQYPSRDKHTAIVNNLVRDMVTATQNHFNLNFAKRFQKYLKLAHNIKDGAKAHYIVDHVFQIRTINPEHPSKFDNNPETEEIIQHYQTKFEHPDQDEIIASKLNLYLPFYYEMLQMFEENEVKKFSILPSKGTMIPNHIKICSTALVELLSKWSNEPVRIFDKINSWFHVFKIGKFITRNHWFHHEITTNGYDVSIYFKIPPQNFSYDYLEWQSMSLERKERIIDEILAARKAEREKKEKEKKEKEKKEKEKKEEKKEISVKEVQIESLYGWYQYILGVDPGKRALFTAKDQDGNFIRCSGKEYKDLTGQKKQTDLINRRKDLNPNIQKLKEFSLKVSSSETYLKHLKEVNKLFELIQEEYQKGFYRKMKFSGYIKKQKTYYHLAKRLKNGYEEVLLGWGNGAVNAPGIKGGCMPVKSFVRYLRTVPGIRIEILDEYRTTMMCSECESRTVGVKYWKEIESAEGSKMFRLSGIYGIRRCSNNECRITWDRDENASGNLEIILERKLLGLARPDYLCRQKKTIKETSDAER